MSYSKYTLALVFACFLVSAFAQEQQIAIYVFGAGEAGINKSFGNKLLATIVQSSIYAEIKDSETFYKELAKNNEEGIGQITKTAKQHGADFVCIVSMTKALGAYSILARIIKTSDSEAIGTAQLDHSLNTLDDLTKVSNELVDQLFSAADPSDSTPMAAAAKEECESKSNINEITSKIQNTFIAQLEKCSGTLAKDMALDAIPFIGKIFGKKKAQKEPVEFMKECTIDGLKKKLPSIAGEYVKPIEEFLQNIMSAASASGGGLDIKKLPGIISGLNVNELIDELKTIAANDKCMADEPYEPKEGEDGEDSDDEEGGKMLSLGFRAGLNFSHLYVADYYYNGRSGSGSYNPTLGFQAGLVLDIAASDWFHVQPGVMYIQKGAEDNYGTVATSHNIEIPLLLSLKFSALRLNAGPYLGICLSGDYIECGDIDIGISTGFGFDIGMFYIGMFYDYDYSNRTFGLNFGVNL